MDRRYRITLDRDDKTADLAGWETGALSLVAVHGDVVVLKEAGHHYWSALHEPHAYAAAQFRVFRLTERIEGFAENWWAQEIVAFPVRGKAGA